MLTDSWRSRGRSFVALLAILVVLPGAPVAAQDDPEAERDAIRRQRDAVAAELDLLEASDGQIHAALDELDDAIEAQQQAVEAAEDAVGAAEAAVAEAERELRLARRDVRRLERAIAEMAVASYMHPPTVDLVQSLQAASFSDALLQQTYLDARARRDLDLLDLLEVAEATAAERAAAVEVAAAESEAALEAAGAALATLRDEESRQLAFAADLRDRIDSSLAEAAVLAELDADLAAQIQAEQAALIARIPPPPPPPVVAPSASAGELPTTPSAPAPTTPADPVPAPSPATPGPAPTTTTPSTVPPRVAPPPVDRDAPPLRTVRGITVHADIAADLEAMLTAASSDGISLSGYGYRSTARQIELRRAHCGPSDWDIWYRPASTCTPPTAVPGRSLHEQGRAVDFTADGRTITSRANPAFRWLADNAAAFGFFNLPSEPWHWSTTGG